MNDSPRLRRSWIILLGMGLLYLGVMLFGGCADKLILYPRVEPTDSYTARPLKLDDNGKTLEMWTDRSPGARDHEPEVYALEFIGNASRAEDITSYVATRWGERRVEVWSLNYPGYGGSSGPAKLASIPNAALRAYDELAKHAGGKPIIVSGNSLGTTAALYAATQRRVDGMILQNPPPLRTIILRQYGWWNLWLIAGPIALQIPPQLDSMTNAPRVNAPAIIVLSDQDEVVGPKYAKMVADAYAGPKRIIDVANGTHNSEISGKAEEELQDGMTWLLERCKESK